MKAATQSYLDKVKLLSLDDQERLLSRMTGKLPKRLQKDKLTKDEAMAIQLELEDEQLQEWRGIMVSLQEKAKKVQEKAAQKAQKEKEALAKKAKAAEEKLAKKAANEQQKLAKKNAPKKTVVKNTKAKDAGIESEVPTLVPAKK
jgi:FKBP-type peptidyl-prolyl cis-trans isomerase